MKINNIEELFDEVIENIKPSSSGIGEECKYHSEREAIVWTGKGMLCGECVKKYYKKENA